MMSVLGFKARVDHLTCMLSHLCAIESSDSPLVQHPLAYWWPAWQPIHSDPHTCEQALVGIKPGIYRATGKGEFRIFQNFRNLTSCSKISEMK